MDTKVSKQLKDLRRLRGYHGFRAETLVPDLALIGLVDDIIDAVETAIQLLQGDKPHRAYSMARVAFEAAQRLLVLGTSENYLRLGTRAWLYYQIKDEILGSVDDAAEETARKQIIAAWENRFPTASEIVLSESENLIQQKKQRSPDNFLGMNMGDAVNKAYEIITAITKGCLPEDSVEINRKVYQSLCREAHACVRLEPRDIRIDADGFVEVEERIRERALVEEGVFVSLQTSLSEAIVAVEFRLMRRHLDHITQIRKTAIKTSTTDLPPSYLSDFGMYLVEHGTGGMSLIFPGVPLAHFRELPDGTLSSSVATGIPTEAYLATFDFKGTVRTKLIAKLQEEFPDSGIGALKGNQSMQIDLPSPLYLNITATIGNIQKNGYEQFVPLVVLDLK